MLIYMIFNTILNTKITMYIYFELKLNLNFIIEKKILLFFFFLIFILYY